VAELDADLLVMVLTAIRVSAKSSWEASPGTFCGI
jgi:hypothetical protein